jgi:hypothetical protein
MDPLLSTVTLNVKRGKLRVESPEGRVKQVNKIERIALQNTA